MNNTFKNIRFKQISFSAVILLLTLPFLQSSLSIFSINPLKGSTKLIEDPYFKINAWFEGEFQSSYEKYTESNFGFHNWLIKLNNQVDYSLFKKPNAIEVIAGKDDFLFEETYIQAYNGLDFVGKELIDNQILKMHFVQKELAKLHKHLIIVFAPNKARYYSDKIPEHYGTPLAETNYSYFKKRLSDFNLNLLDLNSYFVSAKDTCRIPLISKCSIHWSQYGAAVAADSLCRLVANLTSETTCNFTYTLNANSTAKDQDILDAMNLICDIEYPPQMIPSLKFNQNNCRLRFMGVGDSFYKNFFYLNIPQTIWNQGNFRYYNRIYSTGYNETDNIENKDVMEDVSGADVIVLLASEVNLWRFPFGFIDQLYYEFAPVSPAALRQHFSTLLNDTLSNKLLVKEDTAFAKLIYLMENKKQFDAKIDQLLINVYKKRLMNNEYLLNEEIKKKQPGDSNLLQVINRDAEWLNQTEKNQRLLQLQVLVESILSNPELMEQEKIKARERNMTLDQIIKDDAKWLYSRH